MSFEEARVIAVVYIAVFLPFLIYFKKKSSLPRWIPTLYLIAFFTRTTPSSITLALGSLHAIRKET